VKLISDYRNSEIGWGSVVILGMVAVLCFTLCFIFLCDIAKVLFAYLILFGILD